MPDFDDPMAALRAIRQEGKEDRNAPATPRQSKPKQFDNPLQKVSYSDVAKATKSSAMVGNYAQRTFRLPPEYLELIRQIAANEVMSIADAERWVVGRGLLAYFDDGEKPEFEQSVRRRVTLPNWQIEE